MNDKEKELWRILDNTIKCCAVEVAGTDTLSITRGDVLGKSRAENLVMTRCILAAQLQHAGYSITTIGDVLYLSNMAYADFFPSVIKTEEGCIKYALAVARDPDGYEGMPFLRWTADLIGKGATIDWEKLE